MPKIYDNSHPLINSKLMKTIQNGRMEYSDENMNELLNELFDSNFLIPIGDNYNLENGLFDIIMLCDDLGLYIPIFTNYFEMRKMKETVKNQKSLFVSFDEAIDLSYELYEYNILGVIVDPFGVGLYFDNKMLCNMQQIMQVKQQSKVLEELKTILASANDISAPQDNVLNKEESKK